MPDQDQAQTTETLPNPLVKHYANHSIELNSNNWEFTVTGPEFKDYKVVFSSYTDARKEIEKRITETRKIEVKRVRFRLQALDGKGNSTVIERINRRNGEIEIETKTFYPDVPWIREALLRRQELRTELWEIDKKVAQVELRNTAHYGRIDAEIYAEVVQGLTAEFQEKLKLAQELENPKPEENKTENDKESAECQI